MSNESVEYKWCCKTNINLQIFIYAISQLLLIGYSKILSLPPIIMGSSNKTDFEKLRYCIHKRLILEKPFISPQITWSDKYVKECLYDKTTFLTEISFLGIIFLPHTVSSCFTTKTKYNRCISVKMSFAFVS